MTPARGLRTSASRQVPGRTLVIPAARSKADFIAAALGAVRAPGWAGHNWDALADVLADLSWLPEGPLTIVWRDPLALRAADPSAYRSAVAILRDAASATRHRPVAVVLTVH